MLRAGTFNTNRQGMQLYLVVVLDPATATSVTLGAALMTRKDATCYIDAFTQFKKLSRLRRDPGVIITDQVQYMTSQYSTIFAPR